MGYGLLDMGYYVYVANLLEETDTMFLPSLAASDSTRVVTLL